MLAILSDIDRAKLVRLLGMLNSSFDAERATAGALADRFIRDRKLTWDQVVAQEQGPYQDSPPQRTWRDIVADCQRRSEWLNRWEHDFLASLSMWRGSLTPRQAAKLADIAERLGVEPAS